MSEELTNSMVFGNETDLDRKIIEVFEGVVVRKDLSKYVKLSAVLPSYVLEYLLGESANGNDEDTVMSGVKIVQNLITTQYVEREKAVWFQSQIRETGQMRILDKVEVTLDTRNDVYHARFHNLSIDKVRVTEDIVTEHDKLLIGGLWCEVNLRYEYIDKDTSPFILVNLKPIQYSKTDLNEFIQNRSKFTSNEWLGMMMQTIGWDPNQLSRRTQLMYLLRLAPFVERNYNLIELGPKGTGKTHVNSELSPHGTLLSGSQVTKAKLFGEARAKAAAGLIGTWDNITFDEFASKTAPVTADIVNIMKNYMANGTFSRGVSQKSAMSSMSFAGNTIASVEQMLQSSHLFDALPPLYVDSAFLDRMHAYIPGWEIPRILTTAFTQGYGLIVDYLSEIMHQLRAMDCSGLMNDLFELHPSMSIRENTGIRHTFSALVKLLYPNSVLTQDEAIEVLYLAMECRKRVTDQLPRIDSTMKYVTFGFRLKGASEWTVVKTPEEIEFPNTYYKKIREKRPDGSVLLDEALST